MRTQVKRDHYKKDLTLKYSKRVIFEGKVKFNSKYGKNNEWVEEKWKPILCSRWENQAKECLDIKLENQSSKPWRRKTISIAKTKAFNGKIKLKPKKVLELRWKIYLGKEKTLTINIRIGKKNKQLPKLN